MDIDRNTRIVGSPQYNIQTFGTQNTLGGGDMERGMERGMERSLADTSGDERTKRSTEEAQKKHRRSTDEAQKKQKKHRRSARNVATYRIHIPPLWGHSHSNVNGHDPLKGQPNQLLHVAVSHVSHKGHACLCVVAAACGGTEGGA